MTIDGARAVLRDLDEYVSVTSVMEAPETIDMMLCLKEVRVCVSECVCGRVCV